jgi:glutamate-1-semialdehyde 2,1-aminomutase
MLDCVIDHTLVARYNDIADVRATIAPHSDDLAAIILEPALHNAPSIMPGPGFLEELRAVCDEIGALLIFDETITGFRHGLGGYQAIAGVVPDLTTLGKALANGFPVAAVCGRRDFMQHFNTAHGGEVFFAGTYNGHAAGTAAALATIEHLEDAAIYEHVYALGERMRSGIREIVRRSGVPAVVSGHGSLFALSFMEPPLETYDDALRADLGLALAYRQALLERGIFMMPPHSGRDHISASHTASDVDLTLHAIEEALAVALSRRRRESATHATSRRAAREFR